ncbi:hypothetical protein ACW0US_18115 [Xanthomonas euvesicatoria]
MLTHDELVQTGRRWLKANGCRAILHEPFRAGEPEQPDVIGWRDGVSILIEAKASRSDFLADAKKPWRITPERGMGDWRFYIAPAGLIDPAELPDGWGLLEVSGRRVIPRYGVPLGNCSWWDFPFKCANKRAETKFLVSAIASPEVVPRAGATLRRGIDFSAWATQGAGLPGGEG